MSFMGSSWKEPSIYNFVHIDEIVIPIDEYKRLKALEFNINAESIEIQIRNCRVAKMNITS